MPLLDEIFNTKEIASEEMAKHLTSLAEHYDQMADALRDSEAGEIFGDEDIQGLSR